MQGLQGLNLCTGFGQLSAAEVKRVDCLLQNKEVLGAPAAVQTLGDLVIAGPDARVLELGQLQSNQGG